MVARGRRFFEAVLTVFLAGGATAGLAAGPEAEVRKPVTLQLQWRPQAQFAGYILAKEKGFFKEAGLPEVELRWFYEGDPPLKLVLEGRADFCTAWLSQAIALRAKGEPLVNIAQVMQKSAMMLVAHRGSGITRPADMAGRRVGLWGADFDVQPMAFFRKFSVQPEVVIQSYSMAPFLRRAVEIASAMYYNEYHKLMEAGLRAEDIVTFFFSDFGMNFPEDGLYCTETTRRDRASVCLALTSASIKGWAYAAAHEVEALDIIMKYCTEAQLATNRNHQRWMLRAMVELIQHRVGRESARWGALLVEDYDTVAKLLKEQGLIRQAPRYEDFYRPALARDEGPAAPGRGGF